MIENEICVFVRLGPSDSVRQEPETDDRVRRILEQILSLLFQVQREPGRDDRVSDDNRIRFRHTDDGSPERGNLGRRSGRETGSGNERRDRRSRDEVGIEILMNHRIIVLF
jgi:hypothetical protein